MPRQLEFPEGFSFADGHVVNSPAALAWLIYHAPARQAEVLERLTDGDIARWLGHLGFAEAVGRIEQLSRSEQSAENRLARLAGLLAEAEGLVPDAVRTASAPPETWAQVAAAAAPTAIPTDTPTAAPTGTPTAAPIRAGGASTALAATLLQRQRAALQALRTAEKSYAQAEESAQAILHAADGESQAVLTDGRRPFNQASAKVQVSRSKAREALRNVHQEQLLIAAPPLASPPSGNPAVLLAAAVQLAERAEAHITDASRQLSGLRKRRKEEEEQRRQRREAALVTLRKAGLITALAGCVAFVGWLLYSGQAEEKAAAIAPLLGTWTGTWRSTAQNSSRSVGLVIRQQGHDAIATIYEGAVKETLTVEKAGTDGSFVLAPTGFTSQCPGVNVTYGLDTLTGKRSADGKTLQGTWTDSAQRSGTWTLTRAAEAAGTFSGNWGGTIVYPDHWRRFVELHFDTLGTLLVGCMVEKHESKGTVLAKLNGQVAPDQAKWRAYYLTDIGDDLFQATLTANGHSLSGTWQDAASADNGAGTFAWDQRLPPSQQARP